MRSAKHFLIQLLLLVSVVTISKSDDKLKPGFDPQEYKQLLEITTHQADTPWTAASGPLPQGYKLYFRSDTLGLNNRVDIWLRDDSVGIISIRGTVMRQNSWAEDFYAAMVPAKGSLIIDKDFVFIYKLAESQRASVHTGWLTGLAYLSEPIITKINELHALGIKNYLIMGHSQGGAITYLLTSYLHYLDKERIPEGIRFKTYSSAPPKPGNLFYSYDYDFITRGGWSLRVYNSEDWVPQTPISAQTLKDFSEVNPYSDKKYLEDKMGFFDKIIFELILGKLNNTLNDSRDLLDEYFGKMTYNNSISKFLPEFPEPAYSNDSYYYPCGVPVVLMKQHGYEKAIADQPGIPLLFKNHMVTAYSYLLNKIYFEN